MKLIKKFRIFEHIPNKALLDKNFVIEQKTNVFVFLNEINKKHLGLNTEEEKFNIVSKDEINYYHLRDYQKRPLEYIFKHNKVILNLPIRFGKTHISIAASLNVKGNRIFFVDKIMLQEFKNIIKKDFNFEGKVYIYHGNQNKNLFTEDIDNAIILTTEETFLSRQAKFNDQENDFVKTINFAAFDEYHNFIKEKDKRFKSLEKIFKRKILKPSVLIFFICISNKWRNKQLIQSNEINWSRICAQSMKE